MGSCEGTLLAFGLAISCSYFLILFTVLSVLYCMIASGQRKVDYLLKQCQSTKNKTQKVVILCNAIQRLVHDIQDHTHKHVSHGHITEDRIAEVGDTETDVNIDQRQEEDIVGAEAGAEGDLRKVAECYNKEYSDSIRVLDHLTGAAEEGLQEAPPNTLNKDEKKLLSICHRGSDISNEPGRLSTQQPKRSMATMIQEYETQSHPQCRPKISQNRKRPKALQRPNIKQESKVLNTTCIDCEVNNLTAEMKSDTVRGGWTNMGFYQSPDGYCREEFSLPTLVEEQSSTDNTLL